MKHPCLNDISGTFFSNKCYNVPKMLLKCPKIFFAYWGNYFNKVPREIIHLLLLPLRFLPQIFAIRKIKYSLRNKS